MAATFPGLTDADFDAYLPARATSNAYVRPRLAVKEKLLELGRALAERASSAGVALDVAASDEKPTIWNRKSVTEQWIYFWRDKSAREALERDAPDDRPVSAALQDPSPSSRHAFLSLRLDADRFEIGFRIHADAWADVRNARAVLTSDGASAAETTLRALDGGFVVGVAGGDMGSASSASATSVLSQLDAAATQHGWWIVASSMTRAEAIAKGVELAAYATSCVDALLPLYRLLAWSPAADRGAVNEQLVRAEAARQAHVAEEGAREAEWQAQRDAEIARRREQAVVEKRERIAAMEPARHGVRVAPPPSDVQPTAARTTSEPPPRPRAPEHTNPQPARNNPPARPAASGPAPRRDDKPRDDRREHRAAAPSRPQASQPQRNAAPPRKHEDAAKKPVVEAPKGSGEWIASEAPVSLGARVEIRKGPFAGRSGTVIFLDRGVAKVSLGLLSARVDAGDLVTLIERPLSS